MNYDILAKIAVAIAIGGLFADLLYILVKTFILFARIFSNQDYEINYKTQLWIAGFLAIFIAFYFLLY